VQRHTLKRKASGRWAKKMNINIWKKKKLEKNPSDKV